MRIKPYLLLSSIAFTAIFIVPLFNRVAAIDLSFPWTNGVEWEYRQGWHSNALDLGTRTGNKEVLAAGDGQVISVKRCNSTGYIRINHGGNWEAGYFHLDIASMNGNIKERQPIKKGTSLGFIKNGTFNDGSCGYTLNQGASSAHLHWQLKPLGNDRILNIDGWQIKFGDSTFRKGNQTIKPGGLLRSLNAVCVLPTNLSGCRSSVDKVKLTAYRGQYVGFDVSNVLTADYANSYAPTYKFHRFADNWVALQTEANKYISNDKTSSTLKANSNQLGQSELFKISYRDFPIKAVANVLDKWETFSFVAKSGWEIEGRGQSIGRTNILGAWEKFKFIPVDQDINTLKLKKSGKVTIRSYHGPLLQVADGATDIKAIAFNNRAWETFDIVNLGNNKIALKTFNGKYLSFTNNRLKATGDKVGTCETFSLVDYSNSLNAIWALKTCRNNFLSSNPGQFTMQTYHNTYLQAVNAGGSEINANASVPREWETFTMNGVDNGFERVTIKSYSGHHLESNQSNGTISANRRQLNTNSKFILHDLRNHVIALTSSQNKYWSAVLGKVSFQSATNNRFVSAVQCGGRGINVTAINVGSCEKWTINTLTRHQGEPTYPEISLTSSQATGTNTFTLKWIDFAPSKNALLNLAAISPNGQKQVFASGILINDPTNTYNLDASQWANGNYQLIAEAVDPKFGNALSNAVTIKVDQGVNNAAFVSQQVPTTVTAGQKYRVSVSMKNTGKPTWTRSGAVALGSENPRDNNTWGVGRIILDTNEQVPENQIKQFNFEVTAPAIPGNYNFQWRMVQDGMSNGWFGDLTPNLIINVIALPTQENNATIISSNRPASITVGETYPVSIRVKNTGTTTWTKSANFALGSASPNDNTIWGIGRVSLADNEEILPGQEKLFSFYITAPTTIGTFNYQWRMVQDGVSNGWFGTSSNLEQITTVAAINNAKYVSQVVPSELQAGETSQIKVAMKNTGTTNWTSSKRISLGSENPRDNSYWSIGRVVFQPNTIVYPGETYEFIFEIKAPTQAGAYNLQWRMVQDGAANGWFGDFSANQLVNIK